MSAKSLKIDSLELDLENPRITVATDQSDAMQQILDEQEWRLINLAESIAVRGFSQMDRLISTPDVRKASGFEIRKGKLITTLPAEEALKPLKRIVLGGFNAMDKPNLSLKADARRSLSRT